MMQTAVFAVILKQKFLVHLEHGSDPFVYDSRVMLLQYAAFLIYAAPFVYLALS